MMRSNSAYSISIFVYDNQPKKDMLENLIISERVSALRQIMSDLKLAAFIIPSTDPHQSEYVADCWQYREWISGFTGSAGTVVITEDHAGLWTDGRYYLQAEQELSGTGIRLHKQGTPGVLHYYDWLVEKIAPGDSVGINGWSFSVAEADHMRTKFSSKEILLNTEHDLVSKIWKEAPQLPHSEVYEHDAKYAGRSRSEKIAIVREELTEKQADYMLLSGLDDIAWLLNLRGSDVECNPVFIAYVVIGKDLTYLFINDGKIPADLQEKLSEQAIILRPYSGIDSFLDSIDGTVLIDNQTTSVKIHDKISEKYRVVSRNYVRQLKAVKTNIEQDHLRRVMVKDGIALLRLYRWLDNVLVRRTVSEYDISEKLTSLRKSQPGYVGDSFPSIVGYNGNGAIIHYRPYKNSSAQVKPTGILLLDSGGQYIDGTTDITRTTALGMVDAQQKRHFTLVLKGHIALAIAKFPKGTLGIQLDVLARQYLWNEGLNYNHGTGHGVGFFLNVHEPPQGFAANLSMRGKTRLVPGMYSSNEPGFYKEGEYGIRIENLMITQEDESNGSGQFLKMETITLFPIDLKMVDVGLLSREEKTWLNEYHNMVFNRLSPAINNEERSWLKDQCRPI